MDRSAKIFAPVAGFVWGLAEGLFFFIVPDVLLAFLALRSGRAAATATLAVVLGAMTAACILFALLGAGGQTALHNIEAVWAALPGFAAAMGDVAATHLAEHGARGLLSGPGSGIPFRVYVVEAWLQGISLTDLLAWTPVARLERIFLAPTVVTCLRLAVENVHRLFGGRRFVFAPAPRRLALAGVVALYWVLVYVWYWGTFLPNTYAA